MANKQVFWTLLVIFLFALILRVVNLSQIPNALHVDEVHAGYQGLKIIKTGKDIFGNVLPFSIDRFGDHRPAGIFYLSGLSSLVLGLSTLAIRLPAALIGALTVFPLYFLVQLIYKNKMVAVLSAFLLSISPWHIVASRSTSESVIALFLTLWAVLLVLGAIENAKSRFLSIAFLLFIASYFFYHTPRIFIPAFLILITFWVMRFPFNLKKRYVIFVFLITAITIGFLFTTFGSGRFQQTSIFVNEQVRLKIKALEDGDQGNILQARIFHNKPVIFAKEFFDQYLSYFSFQYLYIRGGLPNRYFTPDMGLFYYIELPLLLLGAFLLLKSGEKFFFVPLTWLILAPLAAALTLEDSPNIQRSIFMLPSFQIMEAYGLFWLMEAVKNRLRLRSILAAIFVLGFLLNGIYFFHQYFVHSPSHVSFARNDGNDRFFAQIFEQEKNYDAIYLPIDDDLPIYYYFFRKETTVFPTLSKADYEKGFQAGKYFFFPQDCPSIKLAKDLLSKRILFVDNGNCEKTTLVRRNVTKIYRKDNTLAYIVGEGEFVEKK